MLALTSTVPVDPLMLRPASEENTPPLVPVNVTVASLPLVQYGPPLYAIVALGAVAMVIDAVVLNSAHPPAAAMV